MKDITGQKFGKLTAICSKSKRYYWGFLCDCGNKKIICFYDVLSGQTKSCGCWNKEINKIIHTKHGLSHTRFERIWANIQTRIFNKNRSRYPSYGGRGIRCEWKTFENFRDDMYSSYLNHVKKFGEKQTSIDRIDNDGNYSKNNCRWATCKEQVHNRRKRIVC